MSVLRIRADYILVNTTTLISSGYMTVSPNHIVELNEHRGEPIDIDFGNALLLPGFVNPHTHLEFSDLEQPFHASESFPDWIGQVVRSRRAASAGMNPQQLLDKRKQAIYSGAMECYMTGTTALVDIATSGSSVAAYLEACEKVHQEVIRRLGSSPKIRPLDNIDSTQRFLLELKDTLVGPSLLPLTEILGLQQDRFQEALEWCQQFHTEFERVKSDHFIASGFSPHSPYSISRDNYLQLSQSIFDKKIVAMHIAESTAEREWLETGQGAFRKAFQALGMQTTPERTSIREVLASLNRFDRSLIIHGNYLTPEEMDQIANMPGAAVVYCPRTHKHFQHAPYPYVELKRRRIPVLIGTDSRASSPNLNLWEDLLEARRCHPELEASDAVAAITSLPAECLGISSQFGTIEAGKSAQFNVLPLDSFNLVAQITVPELLATITQPNSNNPFPKPWLMHLLA